VGCSANSASLLSGRAGVSIIDIVRASGFNIRYRSLRQPQIGLSVASRSATHDYMFKVGIRSIAVLHTGKGSGNQARGFYARIVRLIVQV
jgi:hypothetical protein